MDEEYEEISLQKNPLLFAWRLLWVPVLFMGAHMVILATQAAHGKHWRKAIENLHLETW